MWDKRAEQKEMPAKIDKTKGDVPNLSLYLRQKGILAKI